MKPRSAMEQTVVNAVLKELRVALKTAAPVTVIIDPFFDRTGGFILASSDTKARRYEFSKKTCTPKKT